MLASISFRYLKGKYGKFLKEGFENLGGSKRGIKQKGVSEFLPVVTYLPA
jgi:hypothetical protein